jgi:hypothetical protein
VAHPGQHRILFRLVRHVLGRNLQDGRDGGDVGRDGGPDLLGDGLGDQDDRDVRAGRKLAKGGLDAVDRGF